MRASIMSFYEGLRFEAWSPGLRGRIGCWSLFIGLLIAGTIHAEEHVPFAFVGVAGRLETETSGQGRLLQRPLGILGGYRFTWWGLSAEYQQFDFDSGSGSLAIRRTRQDVLAGFRFLSDYSDYNLRGYATTLVGLGRENIETSIGTDSRRDIGTFEGLFGGGLGVDVCIWKGLRFEVEGRVIGTSGISGGWYPEANFRVGYDGETCPRSL